MFPLRGPFSPFHREGKKPRKEVKDSQLDLEEGGQGRLLDASLLTCRLNLIISLQFTDIFTFHCLSLRVLWVELCPLLPLHVKALTPRT
jgi:hypothetical protein